MDVTRAEEYPGIFGGEGGGGGVAKVEGSNVSG